MPQFNITRKAGRHVLWLGLVSSLIACGTTPGTDQDYQPTAALAEKVQQLEASGDYEGIATLYLSLEGNPRQRREWQLRAAEAYVSGNDPQRALDTAVGLNNSTLNLEQQTRYEMVLARAELLLNGPEAAATRLPTYSTALTPALATEVLQTRIEILAASGRREEELLDRLTLDQVAANQPVIQERNREALWGLIQEMPEEQLLTLVSLDPDLAGWVALQRAARVPIESRDEFDERISNWWARFPNHVAAGRAKAIEQARRFSRSPARVALLLPLSGRYGPVGEAIQQGFMAALANDFGQQPQVQVYDTEAADLDILYQLALSDGAELIVGPLLKDRVARMAQRQDLDLPLLALNRISVNGTFDTSFFQFGLVPEDEVHQIAVDSIDRGRTRALVLYPTEQPEPQPEDEADTETVAENVTEEPPNDTTTPPTTRSGTPPTTRAPTWGERLRDAFVKPYTQSTGDIVGIESYSPNGADFTGPIKSLLQLDASEMRHADLQRQLGRNLEFEPRRRQDADIIFLAATAKQAQQVYPQLRFYRVGDLPVVATSHVYTGRPDPIRNRDLDGLFHLEIPWIVDRGQTPLGQYGFPEAESESRSGPVEETGPPAAELRPRLFAMGADAYQLLPWLAALRVSTGATLNGATGILSSDAGGRIRRRLLWANFEDGLVVKVTDGNDSQIDSSVEATDGSGGIGSLQ